MGRSHGEECRCKRHPKPLQSTGVCPFCLKEKLSRLSSSSSTYIHASSPTASSSPYSPNSELCSLANSPTHHRINKGFSLLVKEDMDIGGLAGKSEPLAKTSSFVFVVRRRKGDAKEHKGVMEKGKGKGKGKGKEEKKTKKKRRSFWFKLLSGSKKGQKEGYSLLQSETVC